jgi:uncharacterized protein
MKNRLFWGIGMSLVLVLVMALVAGCSSGGAALTQSSQPAQASQQAQPISVNVGSQQTGIWVNGQGKISVTPDIATISLGVSSQKTTVAEAQSDAAVAMDKIMAALTRAGVEKKDIQTQGYSIQQVTRWDDKGQIEVVLGFRVSNTVVAKLRAMDKAGSIIDSVAEAGGDNTRINGIDFMVEKPEQYNTQLREAAMKDAQAKAQQIASLAGVKLGAPTYVSESSYVPTNYPIAYKAMDSAGAGARPVTSISAGETDITLSVQVTYSIQ